MNATIKSPQFDLRWRGAISDYITAIAWSPDGKTLAVSDAAGEVALWNGGDLVILQPACDRGVDCLAFSQDGQFLATGRQDGQVQVWRWQERTLIATLEKAPDWIEHLAWSPTANKLAFSFGRYVQLWDAETKDIEATLNFDNSSVLSLAWRPDGDYLAVAGYQGAKIWHQDWSEDPYVLMLPSASLAIAWSYDGKYLAAGNMDRTITVLEWNNPHPWVMRGFPGKVRRLAWSKVTTVDAPLLAASAIDGIVVWSKHPDEFVGWEGTVLERHTDVVEAIAFASDGLLLASASIDGQVCLWHKAKKLIQVLTGAPEGFSQLAWHPQEQQLAAGGKNGEVLVWSKATRGAGFGRS